MTALGCAPQSPTGLQRTTHVADTKLPVSGLHAVLTQRGTRQTLEILDGHGQLLSVVSDSVLDPAVLRGSWRGARGGRPWALAVGRCVASPISVTFSAGRSRLSRQRIEVTPVSLGEFWVAESATAAGRVAVAVAGTAARSAALQPLS